MGTGVKVEFKGLGTVDNLTSRGHSLVVAETEFF